MLSIYLQSSNLRKIGYNKFVSGGLWGENFVVARGKLMGFSNDVRYCPDIIHNFAYNFGC